MQRKIFITGVSGFLGWHLCQQLRQTCDIYGTYFSHPLEIPGVKSQKINLANESELKNLFLSIQPDAVIHTAALSQPNYCQNHPTQSYAINVQASRHIAQLCADAAIPCLFTSTDLVFDGLNPPYAETDPVNPVNIYGEHKVLAEQGMLEIYPQTTICRMPLMFGNPTPTATSFIQGFIHTLQQGQDLKLFIDEYRTPVSGTTAATGLLLALTQNIHGILHLGGKERISRYEFGQLMVEAFQLPKHHLQACHQADVNMAAPRPQDVSLNSSQAFSYGYNPPSIAAELAALSNL